MLGVHYPIGNSGYNKIKNGCDAFVLTLIAIRGGGGVGRKIHVSVVIQIHVGGCDEEEEERVLMILATLLMMVEIISSSFS